MSLSLWRLTLLCMSSVVIVSKLLAKLLFLFHLAKYFGENMYKLYVFCHFTGSIIVLSPFIFSPFTLLSIPFTLVVFTAA